LDRFTWGVIAGVLALSAVAVATTMLVRQDLAPPDLGTPEGVVTAYVLAIQDRRADDAWALLDSPAAAGLSRFPGAEHATQDTFRQQVNSTPRQGNRRVRIVDTRLTGESASVEVEIVTLNGGPALFGSSSYTRSLSFSLRQHEGSWRITAAPSIWDIG
jgi:hypothetical protein